MSNEKANLISIGREPVNISPPSSHGGVAQGAAKSSLGAYRSYISFGSLPLYSSQSQLVTFQNLGNRPLVIRNLASGDSAFTLSETTFSIPPGESRMLRISFSPNAARTYSSSISFQTNDSDRPGGNIFITGQGVSR